MAGGSKPAAPAKGTKAGPKPAPGGNKKVAAWVKGQPKGVKKPPAQTCIPCHAKGAVAKAAAQKMEDCPEAKKLYEKAKKANGGKDVSISQGPTNTGAKTLFPQDPSQPASIVLEEKEKNKCVQAESLAFELANVSSRPAFQKLDAEAAAGKISREEFTRRSERQEYDNARAVLDVLEKCKKKWGCGGAAASDLAFVNKPKDFDDYFNNYLDKGHIQRTGQQWDLLQGQPGATKWVPPKAGG